MVASVSIVEASYYYSNPYFYIIRQGIFSIFGLIVIIISLFIPTNYYQKFYKLWIFLSFLLLILVLNPYIGHEVNGSRRWISFCMFNIQISELVKLCVIMYFSCYLFHFKQNIRKKFIYILKPFLILFLIAFLLLEEPDFGATIVIFSCVFGIIFMSGELRIRWFIIFISLGLIASIFLIIFEPYRLARLSSFLDPWQDPNKSGYQLLQALISYGRGGWFGNGLGNSIQKNFFLPEAHTDFIISIIAEELGTIGVLVLIIIYTILIYKGLKIAYVSYCIEKFFQSYLAYGINFWIAFQVIVNIGVNIGILPTKGLTLPLISYGGSSLLIICFVLGILLRIDYENKFIDNENFFIQ